MPLVSKKLTDKTNPVLAKMKQEAALAYTQAPAVEGVNWDLVNQYLPLLKSLVGRMRLYFPSYMDIEDIYSLGMAGLVKAAARFDATKSPCFGSYATFRIRGSLLDELRRMDYMPRKDRQLAKELKACVENLEQLLGRMATAEEVAEALGVDMAEYHRRLDIARPLSFISLNQNVSEDEGDGILFQEAMADANAPDARLVCEYHETQDLLRQRIEQLDERPQQVLLLYYYKGLRLAEIAEVIGITESRVCQIHTEAILGLRAYFNRISADNPQVRN